MANTAGNEKVPEPLAILIGALGGEGGGVLSDWIVSAATAAHLPVQTTSIPGVAQRTGATTYYLEIYPEPRAQLNGREPVLSLYPAQGRIDLAVASELLEAGRMAESGFVSPDRTTLIASTHRVYAIEEKAALGDGRFDTAHLPEVLARMSRQTLLFDLPRVAREQKAVLNALLLGVIVGSGALPLGPELFEQAIRDKGVAVDSNLRGLRAGMALVSEGQAKAPPPPAWPEPVLSSALAGRIASDFPPEAEDILREGAARLVDYQGPAYAAVYLERLAALRSLEPPGGGHALLRETARHLALWMSYEDVIRVADLKTRPARFARIRAEAGAAPGEPLRITEYLDPGLEEITAVMPPWLARRVLALAENRPRLAALRRPMRVRTDRVLGFLKLWLMARLRFWRPYSYRFGEEQRQIGRWLAGVQAAAARDHALGVEAARCARLIKGYGETSERGRRNFDRIFKTLVEAPRSNGQGSVQADLVRQAREAALADPEGQALEEVLAGHGAASSAAARPAN